MCWKPPARQGASCGLLNQAHAFLYPFCLFCNCSKPGNSQDKALLPKPFLGSWWLFQTPCTGGGNGSCHQSTGACRSDQNNLEHAEGPRGQAQRCCSRPSLWLSSWVGCESVATRDGNCTTASRCVPTLSGTPGRAGNRGFGGVREAGLLAELSIPTSSAGHCRASAKLLSLPK